MNEKQNEMWETLTGLDGETVTRLFTDYHGLQLLNDVFYGQLIVECYIDEPEEKPDTEELIAESDDFEDFCVGRNCMDGCPLFTTRGDCEEIFNRMKKEAMA